MSFFHSQFQQVHSPEWWLSGGGRLHCSDHIPRHRTRSLPVSGQRKEQWLPLRSDQKHCESLADAFPGTEKDIYRNHMAGTASKMFSLATVQINKALHICSEQGLKCIQFREDLHQEFCMERCRCSSKFSFTYILYLYLFVCTHTHTHACYYCAAALTTITASRL